MRYTEVTSIGAVTGSERPDGWIAMIQTGAKRQLGHVASHLFSSRSPLVELVVVGLISIILLRTSG